MPFFLSSVKKANGCTSKVLLDGECVSSALLIKERMEAEIQIYPCVSQCCLEQDAPDTKDSRPLKLHMLLSALNRFVFSLFHDDKRVLTSTQDLPASRITDSLRNENVVCRMFLFIENQLIKISLYTTSGFSRDVFMQPQWHSHQKRSRMIWKTESLCMFQNESCNSNTPGRRNERRIWISQDLDPCSKAHTIFDDRKPIKMGLTGAFHWDGLRLGQTINVIKLKFWLSETCITGFQATYIVNGHRVLGPRNQFLKESKSCWMRVFELADNENISCIHALSNIYGYLARVFIVTDRGRFCALATSAPAGSGKIQLVLRHPNAKVVGFRGSFETGLINFGIVCELDKQIAKRIPEGLVCFVCGAHSAYFSGLRLFRAHVDSCIEHLVNSPQ